MKDNVFIKKSVSYRKISVQRSVSVSLSLSDIVSSALLKSIKDKKDPSKALISEAMAIVRNNDENLEEKIHLFKLIEQQLIGGPNTSIEESKNAVKKNANNTNGANSSNNSFNSDFAEQTDDTLGKEKLGISIKYSFSEEEFKHSLYSSKAIDYVHMFYGDTGKVPPVYAREGEYTVNLTSDTTSETIETNAQAQKTLVDIQYAAVTGAYSSVSFKERKQFDLWIKFNPAFFNLYQTNFGITQEIDYSRTG